HFSKVSYYVLTRLLITTPELIPDLSVNNYERVTTLELPSDSSVNYSTDKTTLTFPRHPRQKHKNDCTNYRPDIVQTCPIILKPLLLLQSLLPRALLGIPCQLFYRFPR